MDAVRCVIFALNKALKNDDLPWKIMISSQRSRAFAKKTTIFSHKNDDFHNANRSTGINEEEISATEIRQLFRHVDADRSVWSSFLTQNSTFWMRIFYILNANFIMFRHVDGFFCAFLLWNGFFMLKMIKWFRGNDAGLARLTGWSFRAGCWRWRSKTIKTSLRASRWMKYSSQKWWILYWKRWISCSSWWILYWKWRAGFGADLWVAVSRWSVCEGAY